MSILRRLSPGAGSSRLLCLPYAGGGGSMYEDWLEAVPSGVELWATAYPAHEHRMLEDPIQDLAVLVGALAEAVTQSRTPISLFGHSFGALVGFELARRLQECRVPLGCLVVSGMAAPQTLTGRFRPTDAQILADLRRHGVAPPQLFAQPDLVELLMPGLRADYAMAMGYRYRDGPRLAFPIHAIGGTEDAEVPAEGLEAWADQTRAECRTRMWDGGHMYVVHHARELAAFAGGCHVRSVAAGSRAVDPEPVPAVSAGGKPVRMSG